MIIIIAAIVLAWFAFDWLVICDGDFMDALGSTFSNLLLVAIVVALAMVARFLGWFASALVFCVYLAYRAGRARA